MGTCVIWFQKKERFDPDNDFEMKYEVIEKRKTCVRHIQGAKKSTTLYLATDPDREGEAISWHLYEY